MFTHSGQGFLLTLRATEVLLYDHRYGSTMSCGTDTENLIRGIGDSIASEHAVQSISIEVLARDLLALITHLGWKDVNLCGWSMGGESLSAFVIPLLTKPLFARCHRPTTLGSTIPQDSPSATSVQANPCITSRYTVYSSG
jgi:pimeloyl-ACP methyl ester carboxylesterase